MGVATAAELDQALVLVSALAWAAVLVRAFALVWAVALAAVRVGGSSAGRVLRGPVMLLLALVVAFACSVPVVAPVLAPGGALMLGVCSARANVVSARPRRLTQAWQERVPPHSGQKGAATTGLAQRRFATGIPTCWG